MDLSSLETARQLHREGRFAEALSIYRQLTPADSVDAVPWELRAIAEQQVGQLDEARRSIGRAIELDAARAESHLIAGHVAEDLRQFESAEASFRRAVELKQDWVSAWNALGLLLLSRGRAEEALACFQRSVDVDGRSVRSWNYLGRAQTALQRLDEAVRSFSYAVTLEPRFATSHLNLARVYDGFGETDRALDFVRTAVELDQNDFDARLLLGNVQRKKGDFQGAYASYAAAANMPRGTPEAPKALADLLWEIGNADEARKLYASISARVPGDFKAALGSRLLLPAIYASSGHLETCRQQYDEGLAELGEGADRFRWNDAAQALRESSWTNFYLAYQGQVDRDLQRRYGEFKHSVLRSIVPQWLESPRRVTGRRAKPRIGFLSYFFYNTTVGRYFGSWIRDLDPERFESFVYYTNPWFARDTEVIAAAAHQFRHLAGRSLHAVASQVLSDDLDVLVYPELGMNPETFSLASLRLAPVQVAGWGHPTTTGLPSIDWFLSCAEMEGENAQQHYTERLAKLPGLGTRYARPSGAEEASRADYGLSEDGHLYLLPQSTFKIHPDNDELLADVLERDPKGKIVMAASRYKAYTDTFVNRLAPRLEARGMKLNDRVVFLPFLSHAAYLGLNRICDVMLDTVHWSGGNTSLDAFASGLPVVTLPGELMRGRQTMAMANLLGVPELVATDKGDYVEKAIALARDPVARKALSDTMIANSGELFDRAEPIRAFEEFLEQVV